MQDTKIYKAEKLFTGDRWLYDYAVIVHSGIIQDIKPLETLDPGTVAVDFLTGFIAPAFIDLQIYGANKKLFAVYPEPDALSRLKVYCQDGGAAYCMPTVATNTQEVFMKCIDAIRAYWADGGDGILGLHIEGPWINTVKRGAHLQALIHAPTIDEARELLEYGKDVIKIITLAPEVCSKEVIALIQSYGVTISAGHSNATYAQAMDGFDNGIRAVTHMYNAMSALQHREPGLVGATFNCELATSSIIPDGHHVDFGAVRIAKKIMGERLFAITDAVTETNDGPYQHYFVGDKYESAGILSGSALTMFKAFQNLVKCVGQSTNEAIRMCSTYPAKVIGLDHKLGKIEKGFEARMIFIDDELERVQLIK